MSGCVTLTPDVVVCGVGQNAYRRRVLPCPTCQRRTRHVEWWGGAWYGPTWTCVACGDAWSVDGRHERPFRRGWRQEARRRALAAWNAALSPAAYRAHVRADLDAVFAFQDEQRALAAP